jgi:hypothetical protein
VIVDPNYVEVISSRVFLDIITYKGPIDIMTKKKKEKKGCKEEELRRRGNTFPKNLKD